MVEFLTVLCKRIAKTVTKFGVALKRESYKRCLSATTLQPRHQHFSALIHSTSHITVDVGNQWVWYSTCSGAQIDAQHREHGIHLSIYILVANKIG